MKRILCLTDFSECSLNAIRYGIALLKDEPCEFYVLNVQSSRSFTMDDLMVAPTSSSVYESVIADNKKSVEQLIVKLQNEYTKEKFSFEGIVDYDVFIDSINQVITSKSIDLVIMGTNGISNIKEVVFGSNAINVMRHIKCDTLMVPQSYDYKDIYEMLVLHLDHVEVDINLLETVFNLKTLKTSNKHLYKVYDEVKENIFTEDIVELKKQCKAIGYNYREVSGVPVDHAINTCVQTNDIDLIVLLANKEEVFSRSFLRYIKKIKEGNHRPILIIYK